MFDFHGTRVLIAGGSSGIGLPTAKLLIKFGAEVVIAKWGPDHDNNLI